MIDQIADLAGWLLARTACELTLFAAVGLVLGGIDDLVVDLLWLTRAAWRRLAIYSRHPRATMESLPPPATPGRIAIFVPAWRESAVIGRMLRAAIDAIRHDDYRIYIGAYPNDPDTGRAVLAIGDPRIRLVGGDRAGPTTKAECLNCIWQAMLADERAAGCRCKAIVLHDAEDVIHAQELALYDRMIERFDLVQIPVLPLLAHESRWARTISATYADEFAEAHGKQLVLREAIGASVPSAGVGCAIGRAMMDRIANAAGGPPFAEDCLTEDYEIGLRLRELGGRGAFVVVPSAPGKGPVAVRAHFPETMETAVRQKTRWITGIALAGWDRLRWQGGLAERWMRLRDRRALIAAIVLAAAYLAAVPTVLCWIAGIPIDWPPAMRTLMLVTTGLLCWRLMMRAVLVEKIYGTRQALLSIPRVFIGNLIEMQAAGRALVAYIPGETPIWEKTQHRFPGQPALRLRGRQARFLAFVLGGWLAVRIFLLWPETAMIDRPSAPGQKGLSRDAIGAVAASVDDPLAIGNAERQMQGRSRRSAAPSENAASHNDHPPLLPSVEAGKDLVRFIAASPASPAPPRSFVAQRQAPRHIEAQAYLFVRPGSGRALSQGNALGGSQMAARIALPLNADGKIAAAARLYAPLNGKGAEAALGLDLRIDPGTPLRLSVERRQRLDRAGRAAWSAYMAGGVYRALPGRLILDGYAQAGFVGLRSRNLFADGAIRIERTVSPGGVAGGLGGGLWAAAQPGASRIDIGPRASMRLPLGEHAVSLALEGRFRIAGDARPANGVALTLAAAL